ncbi:rhomboid family intramembrane serine protease [Bosea sp. AS-1]|uniref:rhomboid family intramembrane serine protease n=1 Tax=Bosea sp. AS-1 TaxID=2015316 RepID=UPI000B796C63|nr:rhomboid family intramembrane serine protease [Bosea sp. AS-1]
MFVPIYDGVPLRFTRSAFITYGLIAACTVLLLALRFGPHQENDIAVLAGFGMIPSVLFGAAQLPEGLAHAPPWLTLFSNILLHASFAHLIGNMLFLWVFGDNVEDAMGHTRFLAFFFLCGLGGSLAHALANPESEQPLVGASGAISGIIAAYLMLYPRVRVWGLAFKWIPVHVPAVYTLGGWILFQAASAWFDPQGDIGWWAHLGGLVTGAVLTPLFIRRGVGLFGRRVAQP